MFNENWETLMKYGTIKDGIASSNYTCDLTGIGEFTKANGQKFASICPYQNARNYDIRYGKFFTEENSLETHTGSLNLGDSGYVGINPFYSGWMINIGAGDKPATKEDYNLQEELKNGTDYKYITASKTKTIDAERSKAVVKITAIMQALKDMTIKEIGLSGGVGAVYSASENTRLLFSRDVLNAPVEIQEGEGFTVSLTMESSI